LGFALEDRNASALSEARDSDAFPANTKASTRDASCRAVSSRLVSQPHEAQRRTARTTRAESWHPLEGVAVGGTHDKEIATLDAGEVVIPRRSATATMLGVDQSEVQSS